MMQLFVYLLPALFILAIATFGEGAENEPIQECLNENDPMGATYRGTISETENGLECQRWDTDEPHYRNYKPDDLDNNYCRNPSPDENTNRLPWCYTNVPGAPRWEYCSIQTCESEPIQECLEETDPMGATYRGTISQTENGLECQRWDTDEPHYRNYKPDDLNNNYCRNPRPDENTSRLPWCYTNVPGAPRWEYCSIQTCGSCSGVMYDNKCYLVVNWKSSPDRLDHDEAVEYCKSLGGYLANIYSQSHMEAVMGYIREQDWFSSWLDFRTGMNFDPKANKLTLRDGADASDGLKWSSSTGPMFDDFTNVNLGVDSNPSDTYQYLYNVPPTSKRNVLCEIE